LDQAVSSPSLKQVWMKVQIHLSRVYVFELDFEGVCVHLISR